MSKAKAPKPNSPAAPPDVAAGKQPSQVGAGTQPAGSSSLPAGSAPGPAQPDKEPARKAPKPKLHAKAAEAEIPAAVVTAACGGFECTDVVSARRYPDRWVLVLMSASDVRKVEVPHAP